MKCQVAAGFALATLVGAPLAFSDHFRDMNREPAEGRFQQAVAFRDTTRVSYPSKADVSEGTTAAKEGVREDVPQKSEVFRRDVTYTDVQQKAGAVGTSGTAVVNSTDALLHFYASQRDEAAELDAQSARFRAMSQDATAQALAPMITDHRRLADGAQDLLRDRFSTNVSLAPQPAEPFVSDNANEMLDHDIQAHERTISHLRERMGELRGGPARDLMQDGLAAAQQHLAVLRQTRGGNQPAAGAAGSVQLADTGLAAETGVEQSIQQKGVPNVRQKGESVVQQSVLQKGGPGVRQKGETGVEQKGPGVEQKGQSVVQQKGDRKAEPKEDKEKGKPAPPETFAPVPPTEEAENVTIQPPPPPPAPPPPPPPAPVVQPPPPPPPAPVVAAPRPPDRRPAH